MRSISRIASILLLLCSSAFANPTVSEEDLAKVSADALLNLIPRAKTIETLDREIARLEATQVVVPTIPQQGDPDESSVFLIQLLQAERAVEHARQERAKAGLVRSAGTRIKLSTFEKAIVAAAKNLEAVRAEQAEQRLH